MTATCTADRPTVILSNVAAPAAAETRAPAHKRSVEEMLHEIAFVLRMSRQVSAGIRAEAAAKAGRPLPAGM